MPYVCLSCRKTFPSGGGRCPDCGGAVVAQEGRREAWLEISGPGGSASVSLGADITIGRRSENDITLADTRVSKLHATIQRLGDEWLIRDAASANGTFVGGQPVGEQALCDGDLISIGDSELVFHAAGTPGGPKGVTIVPRTGAEDDVTACLACRPGDFRPAEEIADTGELRADYRLLRAAYLFQAYMGRESDERSLVRNILRFAFELLPADRGAILLRQDEGSPLTATEVLRRDSAQGDIVIPDSILRRAVEDRQAVLSADAVSDLRFRAAHSVLSESVRSAMCVPLVGKHEVIGAVHLDTREKTGAFSVRDLKLLTLLAGQAAAIIEQSRLHRRLADEAGVRERLSRFLPRELLDEVLERGIDLQREARTGMVSVLFCDIRNFSGLSESMHPAELQTMLNAFFERMVEVVFDQAGMLDKFIGDALMAVWGAPIRRQGDAGRALSAALLMLEQVELFNMSPERKGLANLQVGVGINSGEAVIGAIGSQRRMEYTVLGDTVNLASRVCGLAKGGQVLATAATIEEARQAGAAPNVRGRNPVTVRGRRKPVRLFEVLK